MSWRTAGPWTCGVFVAALFLGGCAGQPLLQTQPPVVEQADDMGYVLARNDAGMLYLIYSEDTEQSPAVVIEHDSRRYLFVSSFVDGKTAHLLPLVPVPEEWIAGAVETRAPFQMVDSLVPEVLSRHLPLSGTFGVWSGAGEYIDWFGDVPTGRQVGLVAALSNVFMGGRGELRSLTETARGIVEFEGNEVEPAGNDVFLGEDGPYLVIPDGPVRSVGMGQSFGVVCLNSLNSCMDFLEANSREDFGNASLFQVNDGADVSKKGWTAFEYGALGRRFGANAFLSMNENDSSVALGRRVFGRRDLEGLMPLAIGDQALVLAGSAEDADIRRMLAGLAAMLDGNLLSAAYLLRDVPFAVDGKGRKGELQRLELLSAAGFSDWGRSEILRGVKTLDTQTAVALARSYVHALDFQAAAQYVEIALKSVGKKDTVARGEILQLKARMEALAGESALAAETAEGASAVLKAAGKPLSAAAMQLEQAEFLLSAGRVSEGFAAGLAGRVGFVGQEDAHWAADAELRLASWMLDYDRRADAMALLESVFARLGKTPSSGLMNRARMVGLRARQQVQPGFDAESGLLATYEQAVESGDLEGAAYAAGLLLNTGFKGEEEDRQRLVLSLVAGIGVVDNSSWNASIRVALTTSCYRGETEAAYQTNEKARFDAACQVLDVGYALDPNIVAVWIGLTYKYLQTGQLVRAEIVMDQLRELLMDYIAAERYLRAAEIVLLDAVLLEKQREGDSTEHLERVGQALKLLEESLESEAFSAQVLQFSEQFRVRGIDWLAVLLRQKYVDLADGEQDKAERVVEYAQLLHEAGRWAELLELSGTASGDSVESAMLALYRSDAAYQLGDRKRALALRDQAIRRDSVLTSREMFGLLKLAIQVDVRRGDLKRARAVGEAVESVKPTDADVQSEGARCALAGLLGARAEVLAMLGEHEKAQQLFGTSLAMFGELPVQASASVRVEVVEAWGRTAQSVDGLRDAIEHLELFQTQLSHVYEPAAARDARVALIGLMLLRSDVGAAQDQFVKLMDEGMAAGATAVANPCLRARIGFQLLFESASGLFGDNLLFGVEDGQEGLIGALRACAEYSAQVEDRAEAAWMASLIDPDSTLAERLARTRAFEKALAGVESREVERLKYFVELGTKKQESERGLVGLGSAAQLMRELRPLAAQRVLAELVQDDPRLEGLESGELAVLMIQMSVMLSRWEEASFFAAAYEKNVVEVKDPKNLMQVRALVKRFSL